MRAPRSPVVRIKGLGRAAGSAGTRTLAKGTMAVEMTLLEKRVTATTVAEMAAVMERMVAGRAGRHPRLALLVPGLRGRRPGGLHWAWVPRAPHRSRCFWKAEHTVRGALNCAWVELNWIDINLDFCWGGFGQN